MKKNDDKGVAFRLPGEAMKTLEHLEKFINEVKDDYAKGPRGMSDEMVKKRTKEHEFIRQKP